MEIEVRRDEERSRFVVDLEGEEAYVAYQVAGPDSLDLRSTFVPPAHRNRGIGERLVLEALGHAREKGLRVIPTCPFVGWVVERHPEFEPLVQR